MLRTAYVSTYTPRRSRTATFTSDLADATGSREIVALHAPDAAPGSYPAEVHHRIRRDERPDYARTARALAACVDLVSIQHDDGIWGGVSGDYVLDFVEALDIPSVATLHSVLRNPSASEKASVVGLVSRADTTVVMSQSAADLLRTAYGIDGSTVEIIPHGVPDVPLVESETLKNGLGLSGRPVILSFGLLGPEKGLELVLDSLPAVVAAHPSVCYVIAGATQPDVLQRDGESYRESLQRKVVGLGLEANVRFHDKFMGRIELLRWLEAADIFATPYPNLDLTASGTLANAMGAGRAIVSTPFNYASELLSDGHGVLVPTRSADAWATALTDLLDDHERRAELGRMAYARSRGMVWSLVAEQYHALSTRIVAGGRHQRVSTELSAATS